MRIRKTVLAAVMTLATPTIVLSTPVAEAQPAPITWEDCPSYVNRPGAQCGRIDVPRDYSKPEAEKISVGFMQFNPQSAKEPVFVNPGGPGGSVYSHYGSSEFMQFPDEYFSRFNIVAVQPRGLAGSTGLDCVEHLNPHTPVDSLYRKGAMFREACEAAQPGLVGAITTENTARDWEEVRKALKLDKISIHGLSYGTILGSTYATLFPAQTNRVVLESGIDSEVMWADLFPLQETGYQNALHDFFSWTAQNDDKYHLGATPYAVYTSWANRVKEESGIWPPLTPPKATAADVPVPGSGQSGADVMNAVEPTRVEAENLASQLATQETLNKSLLYTNSYGVAPIPAAWGDLAERWAFGKEPTAAEQPISEELQLAQRTSLQMQFMVMCNENHSPITRTDYIPMLWHFYVTKNGTAATSKAYTSGTTCEGSPPVAKVPVFKGAELAVQPLQIQATGDPQTPYNHFWRMQKQMNSRLVTVKGPGHMQFGAGNQNVDQLVIDYLSGSTPTVTEVPGYFG